MSINADTPSLAPSGLPELTPLGKRLEMLRIERGLSKQQLARFAVDKSAFSGGFIRGFSFLFSTARLSG